MSNDSLSMPMIDIKGLRVYFGRHKSGKNSEPVDAFRDLLSLVGIKSSSCSKDGVHRNSMGPGWVLRGINLAINRGEVVFLTGHSHSGKSVLLKVLSRAIAPSEGVVKLVGEVCSLLSIADNLDVRLTAIENIRHSQYVCCVRTVNIKKFTRDIIQFAGLEGFEDVPLRTYSTGMVMRLSVALAICATPDVILIDEVLGVGDIEFRQKCIDRLHELKNQGCTILIVSDDEILLRHLSTRKITLGSGQLITDEYQRAQFSPRYKTNAGNVNWHIKSRLPFNETVSLDAIRVSKVNRAEQSMLCVKIDCSTKVNDVSCRPLIDIIRGKTLLWRSLCPKRQIIPTPRLVKYWVELPISIFRKGSYYLSISLNTIHQDVVYSLKVQEIISLEVLTSECESSNAIFNVDFSWRDGTMKTDLDDRQGQA